MVRRRYLHEKAGGKLREERVNSKYKGPKVGILSMFENGFELRKSGEGSSGAWRGDHRTDRVGPPASQRSLHCF